MSRDVFYLVVVNRRDYGYTVVTNITERKFEFHTKQEARDFIKKFPYNPRFDSRPFILECTVVQ